MASIILDDAEHEKRLAEHAANAPVWPALTENDSAHSDLAVELFHAAKPLDAIVFCPDRRRYAYAVAHTRSLVIFAVATGMQHLTFRLPSGLASEAIANGAAQRPTLPEGWVAFDAFVPSESRRTTRARLARWCRVAYEHALIFPPELV